MYEAQNHAARTLAQVLSGKSLNAALQAVWLQHTGLTAHDRASIQNVCYGALRHYGQLDAVLALLLDRPVPDAALRCLLIAALFQLEYTRAAPHAVVDQAVMACVPLGVRAAQGMVNAVLRNFLRRRAALLELAASNEVGRYSHPQWWIDRLKRQYPEQYAAILAAGNSHPPMCLRINRRRTNRAEYLAALAQKEIAARAIGSEGVLLEKPTAVDALPGFRDGLASVQDAGAQLAAHALDICDRQTRDRQTVLDACAAPGGKSAHLLELADIELTALDSDAGRLRRVHENLDRLGFAANVVCADAQNVDAWWDGRAFDRILADVPCSASGVVRRHPDAKWLRREADIAQFSERQARLLDALWRTLATDGKLLYATCSVFDDENQRQIAGLLDRHPDARRLPLDLPQNHDGQLLPNAQHDGFYYALLQKR
ncbi:MAG: 16S rRNA (cytosine(967)-C(5))-methyltransferase RsmB [Burkholderiales bacterium]|nr:16S rRNA (cytosine(967)-C(5))-methyltransferase RsmB [Burkholderiales bacterium]MDQ3194874.1 16S rRNA (cytosine(967)-C(5))-methyltransferase RsmB [Pseudomonadota bacterium]